MTIRDFASRHPVLVRRVVTVVLLVCLVAITAWDDTQYPRGERHTWIMPVGIALILSAGKMWDLRALGFRCASCQRSFSRTKLVFLGSKPACPYCGANFDLPVPTTNERTARAPRVDQGHRGYITPKAPVTYRARPLKKIFLAFVSCLIVVLAILAFPRTPFAAIVVITVFGLGALAGVIGSLPGSSYLTLTDQGFLFVTLFRKRFVDWSNVQSFATVKLERRGLVGWNYSPGFSRPQRYPGVSATFAGVEAFLPDTYGMSAEQLADLMNAMRDAHTRSTR